MLALEWLFSTAMKGRVDGFTHWQCIPPWRTSLAACLLLVWPVVCRGHRDIELQVAALTGQIAQQPANAELYFRRGELHRYHQDWALALADYDRALQRDTHLEQARLARAATVLESGQPAAARTALDAYLSAHPDDATALLLRARALAALNEYVAAAADYAASIARQPQPQPEYFIEQARTLVAAGPQHVDDALRCLDAGLAKLGAVPTLAMMAFDLELGRKNYDGALARLDKIVAGAARKEFWLERRGEVLEQAGRATEAREAYAAALSALETLPAHRRHVAAVEELEGTIRTALKRLGAPTGKGEGDGRR